METPVLVAIIGGAVTLAGFLISGVFGVLASASTRESAANLGVEKALRERLSGKDDQIAFLNKRIENLEAEKAEDEEEIREKDARIAKLGLDVFQCEQEKQRLEQAIAEGNRQ